MRKPFFILALLATTAAFGAETPKPDFTPPPFHTTVRRQGDDGVHTYRIPGLAVGKTGTLFAVFDIRHKSAGDLPGRIDVGLMRSRDAGATWGKMQTVLAFDPAEPDSQGNGVGDPAILVDRRSGTIFVAALWSKGNRGWNGSGPGIAPKDTGQFVITHSDDDGQSWSKPVSITPQIKQAKWRLCFQGPGRGIQLTDGTLVFAAQFRDADGAAHSCFVFSRDAGKTWRISPPAAPDKPPTSESQIVQLDDHTLLLSMRDESRSGKRLWNRFTWKNDLETGQWGVPWSDVPDPTCMASLVRHPTGTLLFSNPNSSKKRIDLTVRVSLDNGKKWSAGRLIQPGPCAYSCMAALPDGQIGILYECGEKSGIETLTFARFPLDWVLDKKAAEPAAVPTAPKPAEKKPVEKIPLSLGLPFSDHMVLQRDRPIGIWGKMTQNVEVTVKFGNQMGTDKHQYGSAWCIQLEPQPASATPRDLTVTAGNEKIVIRDVLVGDVWVAAGQSNMEWPLANDQNAAVVLPSAGHPKLRLLNFSYAGQGFGAKPFSKEELDRLTPERFFTGRWTDSTPETTGKFSAIGYYFGRRLVDELDVPVGMIQMAVGGSPIEAWIKNYPSIDQYNPSREIFWLDSPFIADWCKTRARQNLGSLAPVTNHAFKPGFLWAAGVERLLSLKVRGVLWYQGESNAESPVTGLFYKQLFHMFIDDWWRSAVWQPDPTPFFFVQLPGLNRPYWPEFRETQRQCLGKLPNVFMAVTLDLGHPTNVHPTNKRPVADRLVRLALAKEYGRPIAASGPIFDWAAVKENSIAVHFTESAGLKTTDGKPPLGFEIAGADGRYVPANAQIANSTVVVSHPSVPKPRYVRYGWQPFPDPMPTLTNASGLPAAPFGSEKADGQKALLLPDPEGFAGMFAGFVGKGRDLHIIAAGGANFPDKRPWEGGVKKWSDEIFYVQFYRVWKKLGQLPRPLAYGASFSVDNAVWCFGGADAKQHHADGFSISLENEKPVFAALPPLPKPCANMAWAQVGRSLFIVGGIEAPDATQCLKTLWELNLDNRKAGWQQRPPCPGPARMLATAAGGESDKLFVLGGTELSAGADGKPVRKYLRDAWCYDPKAGWRQLPDMPRAAVAAPCPAPCNGRQVFVLGGDDGVFLGFKPEDKHPGFSREILAFDTETNAWSSYGLTPISSVTAPVVNFPHPQSTWYFNVIINGEIRPGCRTPENWGFEVLSTKPKP